MLRRESSIFWSTNVGVQKMDMEFTIKLKSETCSHRISFWSEKNVTITGGAGFLGSNLCEELIYRGACVTIVDNFERGKETNLQGLDSVKEVKGDLRNPKFAYSTIKDADIVMDLAGKLGGIRFLSDFPGSILSTNLKVTLNTIEAARKADVERYFFASSSCVYGQETPTPNSEKDAFYSPPESAYGWSKVLGEAIARAYYSEFGMQVRIARLFNVYGPREDFERSLHVIPQFIKNVLEGRPIHIYGTGTQTRSFLYIRDAVEGILKVTESKYREAFNIGSNVETSVNDLANLVSQLCNPKHEIKIEYHSSIPGDIQRRSADVDLAKDRLGWSPKTNLKEGLSRTITWYKSLHRNKEP
jgi:nucleoside-diphosphate-sugar epimerase